MDPELERLFSDLNATELRIRARGSEVLAIRAATREAMESAVAKLDASTKAGVWDAANREMILGELAQVMERDEPRLAKLVTWLEGDVDSADATLTMMLDRADSLTAASGFPGMLERVASLAPLAVENAALTRLSITGLDSFGEYEPLRHAVGRRGANLERLVRAFAPLEALGNRARSLIDDATGK